MLNRRHLLAAPLALAATKKAVNAAALDGLEAAFARERSGQSVLLRTADAPLLARVPLLPHAPGSLDELLALSRALAPDPAEPSSAQGGGR